MPWFETCQPLFLVSTLSLLLTALGLTVVSGLRAYLPLLVVAVGPFIPNGCGHDLITLSQPFQDLTGQQTPYLLVVALAALALAEFVVDKIPLADHVNDVIHTLVRPCAGAAVMAGLNNPLSSWNPWVAAGVGATLALVVHGTKAVVRTHVTPLTLGLGNPVVSLVEDVVVVVGAALAVAAPLLIAFFLGMIALLVFLFARLLLRALRRVFGRRSTGGGPGRGPASGSASGPASGSMPAPPSRPLTVPLYAPRSQPLPPAMRR